MPYVFTTSYIPYNKGPEVTKLYLSTVKKFNSETKGLFKEIITNSVKARKDYIEVVGVSDVEDNNLGKFLKIHQKYMAQYHNIEGYSYDIEVRYKITEALEMIGMKMPE
jgi:hypothetical protein